MIQILYAEEDVVFVVRNVWELVASGDVIMTISDDAGRTRCSLQNSCGQTLPCGCSQLSRFSFDSNVRSASESGHVTTLCRWTSVLDFWTCVLDFGHAILSEIDCGASPTHNRRNVVSASAVRRELVKVDTNAKDK